MLFFTQKMRTTVFNRIMPTDCTDYDGAEMSVDEVMAIQGVTARQEESVIDGNLSIPHTEPNKGIPIDDEETTSATQRGGAEKMVVDDANPTIRHIFPGGNNEQRRKCYEFLVYDAETADVNFEFTTSGRTTLVPAHKCLFAHQSIVFRQMFFGEMMKNDDNVVTQVRIVDATPDEFINFARFFYYGKTTISALNVSEMTYLAHKYNVKALERECQYFLRAMVRSNIVSILWVLPMTVMYDYGILSETCDYMIRLNGPLLIECLRFANCSLETLKSVLDTHFTSRDEAKVFEKCMSWAEESCEMKKLDPKSRENIRDQLGDCFELIRFKEMSPSQLTKCLSTHAHVFLPGEIANLAATATGQCREFPTVVIPPIVKVRHAFQTYRPLLRKLVNDADTADVFFSFGSSDERRVTAHKCILSAHSATFKNELMSSKRSYTFHITDATYEDFFAFIRIVYGYTDLNSHHTELSNEGIDKVLMLLKRYNIARRVVDILSHIENIEDELMSRQNDENLFWLFELSRRHSLQCLHYLCVNQIENRQDIFSSEAFLSLCQESFKHVFSVVLKRCDAATVCAAGLKWAEAFCEQKQLEKSGQNVRTALGEFWSMMPFGGLEPTQFIRYRRSLGDIFPAEQIKNIIDTMADECETDDSDMSVDGTETGNTVDGNNDDLVESDAETSEGELTEYSDCSSSIEWGIESSIDEDDEDGSLSEGELEFLKSDQNK